jgi:hypothetical protein
MYVVHLGLESSIRNTNIMRIFAVLPWAILLASCSDTVNVESDDWKRYPWMVEILGDQVRASQAKHNLDTGDYSFVISTNQLPDSVIATFDKRAHHDGWSIESEGRLARTYVRTTDDVDTGKEYRCISIHPNPQTASFRVMYRSALDC